MSTKESAEAKFSYGIPKVASIDVDLKTALQQTHMNNVSQKFDTYTGKEFDASTKTGFSDFVFYTAKRFNLFIYPVIGRLGTGQDGTENLPLHVQFSGPDMIQPNAIDGSLLEWYQPTWEPGNVFSYPWSLDQLKLLYPDFLALTEAPTTTWATDGSGQDISVNWSEGSGSDVSSGSGSTHTFDTSVSVKGGLQFDGFGAEASAGFEYNKSTSASTMNEAVSTLGESTGIKVFKPAFADPVDYAYAAETYIFGQTPPAGTLQTIPLNTDVKGSGLLRVGFVADPAASFAGGWWSGAYTLPDVALNHPSRWDWTPPPPGTDTFTFNPPNLQSIPSSEFYFIKGLFITPADTVVGPQLTSATAGDVIQLRTRIYNYSLVDMDPGTAVKVRFYGQPLDHTQHQFLGDSFLIGEETLGPLPGFNTDTGGDAQNWVFAQATFDTTNYANQYLYFWVVVWMEQNDQLVSEIEGHGLTSIPPSPASSITSIGQIPIESHSNNVGFYKQPFFVAPKASAQVQAASLGLNDLTPAHRGEGRKDRLVVSVAKRRVLLHEKVEVRARLRVTGQDHDSALVTFYDGDPQQGGQPFDVELIPFVRADDAYQTGVLFKPGICGTRTIVVVATAAGISAVSGKAKIKVACRKPINPLVTCNGRPATIVGNHKANTLFGTPGNDVIHGRGGNDIIHGLRGNDVICGGPGDDQLFGNPGKDQLFGESGNDVLKGGTDNDRLFGQAGNDTMDGQGGNDDNCNGGPGTDTATSCEQPRGVP